MAQRIKSAYKLMPVSAVHELINQYCWLLPAEEVAFTEALGSVLAKDVVASDDLPPFPASIKVSSRGQECSVWSWYDCTSLHALPRGRHGAAI
jgi:hypothetical protein